MLARRTMIGIITSVVLAAAGCGSGGSQRDSASTDPTLPSTTTVITTSTSTPMPTSTSTEPTSAHPSRSTTSSPNPTVVVAVGDIATCDGDGDEQTSDLAGTLVEGRPDAVVLTLGDHAYDDGTTTEFRDCFDPAWGRHRDRIRPSPGNHDFHTRGAAGYFGYFGDAAGEPGKGWYSFDIGTWHVVSLNSVCSVAGCGPGSEQAEWLADDLERHADATCTLAFWHHARFSSGRVHGSNPATDTLWQTLDAAGADLVLAGHEHQYERFAPLRPDGTPDDAGMVSFVVGTGGRSLYRGFTDPPMAGSQHRDATTFGVLELALHADAYDWRFVAVDGSTRDAGTDHCR